MEARYENYPTTEMVEEATEQQLILWYAMLPVPKDADEEAVLELVANRMLSFKA